MSRKKILDSDYEKIVDMYSNGMTQQEIADVYHCSKHSVHMFMKRMNINVRPNGFTERNHSSFNGYYCLSKQFQALL